MNRRTSLKLIVLSLVLIIFAMGQQGCGSCLSFLDFEKPRVIITPTNGSVVSGSTTIQVKANDTFGVVKMELFIDNVLVQTYFSSSFIYQWNTGSLTYGSSHSIQVKAYDNAGNIGIATVVVTIGSKWTFMVYMNGDNNLESYGYLDLDLEEMKQVGSSNGVNIIVQLDRYGNTGCWRYKVNQGSLEILQTLLELDSGSPDTLRDFANWAIANFPAQHYALIIWNHGNGWRLRTLETRGISFDDTSGTYINSVKLKQAINNISHRIDILGMDACLMAMVEVAYQVRDNVDYLVGSQESEPGNGWPYNTILSALVNNPTMSPREFASQIVDKYVASYSSGVTQSALDLSMINSLVNSCNSLARVLINNMGNYRNTILNAISNSQYYDYNDYRDLYNFAQNLQYYISNPFIQDAANDVMSEVQSLVIRERHSSSGGVGNSHGVSIWLPYSLQDFSNYQNLDFATDTHWDEFLQTLYQ